ncbi:MAG: thioredoxin domain-containing protein [Rickettsiales bacterium]|nr:thioredoxin domain-containing protein [Rickettsiales bacterium]
MKKLIILFAMVGVCSLIGANLYSSMVSNEANAATETEAAAETTTPAFDIEALRALVNSKTITPSVPAGAVDVSPIIYGDSTAPVIIEEFASFTCSHCASFHRNVLPKLKAALIDTGVAQLHVYSFVRNAPDLESTMLIQCQKGNNARKKFSGAIMRGQEQWASSVNYSDGLKTIAKVGGMTETDYDTCVADETLQEKVIASRQWFDKQVGVDSTPYFRIGTEIVKGGQDINSFVDAIKAAVAK